MHNGPNNKAARVASRAQGNISSPQPEPSRTIAQEALYSSFAASTISTIQFDEFEYDYEDMEGRQNGDYYPIDIDDRLNERYRIVHKLGHGTFSTIWLALDEETRKYVAIKVEIAQSDGSEGDILTEISQSLANSNISNDKKLLIPTLLDRFEISGPEGTHPCLVTLPARHNLKNAQYNAGTELFQLDVARSLAAQLAIAVSIVHEQGYAHGGELSRDITGFQNFSADTHRAVDIHLRNVLLQLTTSLDGLSVEKLYETYLASPKSEIIDLSVTTYSVERVCFSVPGHEITLAEAKLTLSDFGTAFRPADKSRYVSYADLELRPPEASFEPETPLDFASDIWSLGCAIFEILGNRPLIDGGPVIDGDFERPGEITVRQVELSGRMPSTWWKRWEERQNWYTEEGRPLLHANRAWPWERRLEEWVQAPRQTSGMETLDEDELAAVLKLLRDMFAWRPSDRPNISKVLSSDWMTRWALPAYQKGLREQKDLEERKGLGVHNGLEE
ncbi:related to dis1-suppressing protein kinase dsk1 [Claviceps purpurea 20.1]|uniref:non-specific serine/threonine protein kinase n=1 Tax=Claviceps purpurea (strain 20.1) TaxID=1111077 RepID=M1W8F2_CLAP2|nr:related to dis1-suppressing protein kinase dsk1 [Claviceps purpurea 20.1]